MAEKEKKKDDGISEYVEHVILNPHLEQDFKAIGSPYTIPDTPQPGKEIKKEEKL